MGHLHLGPGTDDTLIDHVGKKPLMSQVVLGQMQFLGPGTDDALIDHIGNNLGCPRLS